MRLATSLVILCAAASTAGADSRFEILDRGDAVEIIAHDVKAAKTAISPVRSRLEVPLVGTHSIPKLLPAGDKTVKVIELDGKSQQVLSVKLDFERPEVHKLAKHAQAYQVGNDLHVILPRQIPATGTTISLPEPTLSPELAAKAAAIAPVIDVKPEAMPEAPKAKDAPKPATTEPEMVPSTGPLIKKTEPAEAPKQEPIAKAGQGGMKNFPILLSSILALLGCIVWVKRRKAGGANAAKASTTIEIIAQKSLGKQAKIVWLNAGGREMIVSVTAQQVRMLGQWKKSETESRAVRTSIRAEGSGQISQPVIAERSSRTSHVMLPEATALPSLAEKSSAVSGLLKLRAKTNVPTVNEDVATDDVEADAVWAREILAATGARR